MAMKDCFECFQNDRLLTTKISKKWFL